MFGGISHKYGIGPAASDLINKSSLEIEQASEIDALIVFDRKVDLISPFVLMRTFAGIVDEHTNGVELMKTSIPNKVVQPDEDIRK